MMIFEADIVAQQVKPQTATQAIHIKVAVSMQGVLLLTNLLTNTSGKAEDNPSTWAPVLLRNQMEFLAPDDILTQMVKNRLFTEKWQGTWVAIKEKVVSIPHVI